MTDLPNSAADGAANTSPEGETPEASDRVAVYHDPE
jgi:hypothetical protein